MACQEAQKHILGMKQECTTRLDCPCIAVMCRCMVRGAHKPNIN